jgi:hypothetical protein
MALDPAINQIPVVGLVPEKLLTRLLRESWGQILIGIIAATFTIGVTYATIKNNIETNAEGLRNTAVQLSLDKQELNDKLDRLDRKLDDINRYLRDNNKIK